MKRLLLRRRLLLPYRSLHSNSPRRPISTSQSSISSEAHENSSDHGAHGELYPGVPLYDLVRGWSLYNLFRCDYIVDNSITIMKFMESTIGRPLTESILRASVFGHFGGEDGAEELSRKVEALTQRKMGVIFSYTSEQFDHSPLLKSNSDEYREIIEAKCNKVSRHYLKSIDHAAHYTKGKPPLIAIKLTAIVDYGILSRLSTLLNYSDKVFMSHSIPTTSDNNSLNRHVSCVDMSFKSEAIRESVTKLADKSSTKGEVDLVDWQNHFGSENLNQLHLLLEEELPGVERPTPLSDQEQQQLTNVMKRLNDIGERAATRNVRVLLDAEQTYYQPAIRNLTLHYMMKRYNLEHPVIYDTVQSYLKNSYQTLLMGHTTAKRNKNVYAIKLVRGAYMDEEGKLAQEKGYENPVHPNKDATDASYYSNMDYLLSHDTFAVLASHNNDTVRLAKKQMSAHNISPKSGQVVFGQLLGMADYVSSPLAHDGYLVYKLFPYGIVREVVPYLARRAQENRGAMKSAQMERELLGKEIRQRLLSVFGR